MRSLAFLAALILTVHGCGSKESWTGTLAFLIMLNLLWDTKRGDRDED